MEGQVNMITLCVPSRGRPTLAKRFYDSVIATCKDIKNVEVRFYLNEDDPCLNDYLKNISKANIWVGPHQSTSFSWNRLALKAKHDIVCLMGDDVQIKTKNWDQKIYDEFEKFKNNPKNTNLLDLGLKPNLLNDNVIKNMIDFVYTQKLNINRNLISPNHSWNTFK